MSHFAPTSLSLGVNLGQYHKQKLLRCEVVSLAPTDLHDYKMPKTDTLDALDNAMTTILTTSKL